ncbi:MAG: DUF4331 family protein [Armatimonadota bacterium]
MKTITILPLAVIALSIVGCGGSSNSSLPSGNTKIGLWATTNVKSGSVYNQQDRLANPVVNEVFATFANDRHKTNNLAIPTNDKNELANDIQSFMVGTAGRSQAITDVVKAVLVPDIMIADLGVNGKAAYLGVQTNGATGSLAGGRALEDDVVDMSLGVVFGTTISALGLAPADGKEIPTLTSDNVGMGGKHFKSSFPYLGDPR